MYGNNTTYCAMFIICLLCIVIIYFTMIMAITQHNLLCLWYFAMLMVTTTQFAIFMVFCYVDGSNNIICYVYGILLC